MLINSFIRRLTSVHKRVESEGRKRPQKADEFDGDLHTYKNQAYQEFDQLDYPHYVPCEYIYIFKIQLSLYLIDDQTLGQMYGEYNEVETEFNNVRNLIQV